MGSKHDSEASFSFQINDAVKGNEECLLADDDFLRDANDYTINTPALSRSTVLEHGQGELTPGQTVPRTKDHGENTSYPPKQFTPSSPVFHHNGAAVNQGLKTPKPSIKFSEKSSTSKMISTTRSTIKWPSPSRAKNLPRPEASPRISSLAVLREEISMLGESDGLYSAPVEQQQEERHSDKDTSAENSFPIDLNMPVPTILQNSTQIRAKAPMNRDHSPITLRSPTQSTPVHEPCLLDLTSPKHNNNGDEPVSTTISVERLVGTEALHRHQPNGNIAIDNSLAERAICSVQNNISTKEREVAFRDGQVNDPMAPLTVSQLSPSKVGTTIQPYTLASNSASILPVSPLRPSRKRPASPLQAGKSKKGKVAARKPQDQATSGQNSVARNPNSTTRRRNGASDGRRDRCSTTRRLISSGSGSRMRSSRMSSLGAAVAPTLAASSHSQSQSQRVDDVVELRNERQAQKRVLNVQQDITAVEMKTASDDSPVTDQRVPSPSPSPIAPEHGSNAQPNQEVTQDSGSASTSLLQNLNAGDDQNRNDNQTEQTSKRATTTRANTVKSLDSTSKLRRSGTRAGRQNEENNNKRSYFLRSQTRSQRLLQNSNRLPTSNMASMSSSSSNSRSIAAMARSQFSYSHYRPVPDYKAEHALLESSQARRKENIVPIIPLSFELHTDTRAKEREKYDAVVKEKEMEMEREREAKRREREEQEEQELRELRRKAIPKANAVPEWYKDAPRRKRKNGQA